MSDSAWKPWYGQMDEDNRLLYGKFTICTTCGKSLPKWSGTKKDPEHILYHGYCSRECASENGYGNYIM